jgi:pentapeptide MXKDX repeat protein
MESIQKILEGIVKRVGYTLRGEQQLQLTEVKEKDKLPKDTLPKDTLPKDTLPKDTLPKDTLPKDTLPKDTLPKDTLPKDTLPKDTLPMVEWTTIDNELVLLKINHIINS